MKISFYELNGFQEMPLDRDKYPEDIVEITDSDSIKASTTVLKT